MPQTKKPTKNSKKKTIKRFVKRAARTAFTMLPSEHQDAIIGLTDPFSPESASARYPDAGSGRTLVQKAMLSFTGSTGTGGAYAFAYDANFSYPITFTSGITGTVVTWNATKYGDWSANLLNTYGHTARPVSGGLRIVNTLSATDSSGYLIIAKGGPPTLGSTTTFDPANFTSYEVHPYTHGGEWHVNIHPRGSNAYNWIPTASYSDNTATSNFYWQTVYIGLFGSKASASPMLIEAVSNFEYGPKEDAPIALLAEEQPVLDIHVQTAVNEVQSSHNGIHAGSRQTRNNKIKQLAKTALVKHVLPFAVKKAKQAIL